jgi:Pvc16 N-terminal domain/Carboxypeptidase regulatory-like domain
MLNLVDNLILRLLDTGWTITPPPVKPSFFFTVPDGEWQTRVRARTGLQLNIYLYEIRENRDFRRAAWDNLPLPDRTMVLSQPPAYIDCHYLISAWSATEDSDMASPVLDEHLVLSEVLRILLRNPDVVPAALAIPGGGVVFQEAHVYLSVAPPEPPRVLNDFWSTMKLPWRPAVMLVVTAPLDLLVDTAQPPLVTTLIQRFAQIGSATIEELIDIGGLVLRAADQTAVAGALVERVNSTQTATADSEGRYVFTGLSRGVHRFRASAAGMTPIERDIDVPADPPATHIFQLSP